MSNNQPVSLFSPDVSTEIWGCIVAHLKLLDRYRLSITCKAMWATVKCIPYPEFATIDSSKNTLGSFHFATLTSVRISGSNIDYNKLKMILSAIKHLARIDLSSISVTERSATIIVLSIPRVYRPHTIIIFAKGSESDRFKNAAAYMKERGVILQCKRLLEEEEEEEAEEEATLAGIRRRRIRTPSPLRGDVGDLRKQIAEMKDVFGAINDNPRAIVPAAIESLVAQHQYVDIQSLVQGDLGHEEPVNVNLAHTAAKAMAPRFLENVALSSKGSCIFITEVEVYLRASSTIDDCANNTITVGCPENPIFVIEQKREFANQWLEAKTYYGKFGA